MSYQEAGALFDVSLRVYTFSLEDRQQSEARIFRLGQSKTCMYTDYCMRGTVDEDVWARLQQKQAMSDFFWTKDDISEDDLVW